MSLFYITYLGSCFGGLELISGACERSIACSTCHVILDPEIYDKLPEPEDEENDMLDLAFALEDTYVCFGSVLPPYWFHSVTRSLRDPPKSGKWNFVSTVVDMLGRS
jgi:hypothetical protein